MSRFILQLHVSCLLVSFALCGTPSTVKSMKRQMYEQMSYSGGCYKLLNSTGVIGCEEPSGKIRDATLMAYKHLTQPLIADRVLLVPQGQLGELLNSYTTAADLQAHLVGVLVDPTDNPTSFSPAPTFPDAALAPYPNKAYPWNPWGQALTRRYFPFPMYLLTPTMAEDARLRASYNHRERYTAPAHTARMSLQMMAAKNSTHCISKATCNPLGGYSVTAAMPPLPTPANTTPPSPSTLPLTLVTAQVDSDGLFHDFVQGAEAPLSGLMALLAAMDVLQALNASASYQRRLVFTALLGEPWGLMGSRRLLWELHRGGGSVQGLNLSRIDQVVEVGPVGRASNSSGGAWQLYAHRQLDAAYGDASALAQGLASAAQGLADVKVAVQPASASNPGIPPSSLMSFLRVKPSIQGVVLTDFDTAIATPFLHSHLDNQTTIQRPAVVAAAAALARMLHGLGLGNDTAAQGTFRVNMTALDITVQHLQLCLLTRSPGFACPLVLALMQPGYRVDGDQVNYEVQRYVGVLPFADTRDPVNPAYKQDISRFIWNYMAWKSSTGGSAAQCDPIKNLCPAGEVCVGWKAGTKAKGAGRCMTSSARYVPAYSAKVECINCNDVNFRYIITNRSLDWDEQHGWPQDPVWAESMWPEKVPDLQLLLKEERSTEVKVLVAGVVLTAATLVVCLAGKLLAAKHLKDQ